MISAHDFPPLLGEGKGGVAASIRTIKQYSKKTITRSRQLRSNSTDAEKKLWNCLRQRQVEGYKFRRQFFIGKYIADFACVEAKLIIEADGGQHNESAYDATRDELIQQQGYHILRFWNNDILNNMEGVLENIRQFLLLQTPPQPSPKRGGSKKEEAV